jgi:Tfp pilus assembly protein PilN
MPAASFGVSPAYVVLGVLAVALAFIVIYVLTSNTISNRKAHLATVQAQVNAEQAVATQLAKYVQFESLAQTRVQTVRQIAAARFDWYQALTDLSKVVPSNTSLAALNASVAPGSTAGGVSGSSGLRSDLPVPAFELTGCTKSQDDVARLMSRLRVINGVTRVTLQNSQKSGTGSAGTAITPGGATGCGTNAPSFDLVVFFQPLPGAGPNGVTSISAPSATAAPSQTSTTATPSATTAATSTTATTATTATSATASPTTGGSK